MTLDLHHVLVAKRSRTLQQGKIRIMHKQISMQQPAVDCEQVTLRNHPFCQSVGRDILSETLSLFQAKWEKEPDSEYIILIILKKSGSRRIWWEMNLIAEHLKDDKEGKLPNSWLWVIQRLQHQSKYLVKILHPNPPKPLLIRQFKYRVIVKQS